MNLPMFEVEPPLSFEFFISKHSETYIKAKSSESKKSVSGLHGFELKYDMSTLSNSSPFIS